ncbi:Membrane-bound lytic murein transglycosylase F [Methylobacterium gregans]|uniref:Membrane-bound lytic murein transglycosylase F n=2 Tax=Methylobacterium gregans TaxID=374424 RepID=A0AA37HMU7_9HYPH|nr:Membrane-bound lytic murein transglycosylase F [Methylobacterium gregans]
MMVERGQDRSRNLGAIIAQAAVSTGVPESFLLRLLKQESGLNPQAVSVKGAQGIAQFMPATAAEMGLDDPFDPEKAIPKAAELLRNLKARYGNWGLAAAAYNAGPGRTDAWLLGRSVLPTETVIYVASITGIDVVTWADGKRLAGLASPAQEALVFPAGGIEAEGRRNLLGLRGIGLTSLPITAGRESLAQPVRPASKSSARAQLVPRDPTDPCAALLDVSSRCLAFTRY